MMHFTRHPFTQTLQVNFGPPIRRDEFNILHDVCGKTVGRVDPPGITKDLLDRPVATFHPTLFPCYRSKESYDQKLCLGR